MKQTFEQRIRRIMSGEARGLIPTAGRAVLAVVEPLYRGTAHARNALYDRELRATRRLPRPVVSVGNLTTGGTGKTPAVQWIVRQLRASGHRPAVLLRGYRRAQASAASDEEQVLRESLGCAVVADPDRFAGGSAALDADPRISAFVLDDGLQHRRLYRDLDVVLIDATNPFGYGHVLPRGMLRESPVALRRARLVLITRSDLVSIEAVDDIERAAVALNPHLLVARTRHAFGEVVGPAGPADIATLRARRVMAFCGIGNPDAFAAMLRGAGLSVAGVHAFPDHHAYAAGDVIAVRDAARRAGADVLMTTEKDWVKLRPLVADPDASPGSDPLPIYRVGVRLAMDETAEQAVTACVLGALNDGALNDASNARAADERRA